VIIRVIVCVQKPSHHSLQSFRPLRMFQIAFRDSSLYLKYCLCFVCYSWSAQVLTVLATLPNSVALYNCCTSSNTVVFNIQAFRHFIMSQQGKRKLFSGLLYITKYWKFSCVLYAHSQFLCIRVASLAFLKPDFEILAFLKTFGFFLEMKKAAYSIQISSD